MAATLRRTFRYPDDADDVHLTGAREELDEEEQEQMVTQLRQKNETDNRFYRTAFSVSPLIATIVYIPPLFSSGGTFIKRLICIICMISLSSTAYIMKSNGSTTEETIKFPAAISKRNRWSTSFPNNINTKQILLANTVVCALLALFSIYSENTVMYLLPGVLLAIISLARQALTEVDISELEKMRYKYKGP